MALNGLENILRLGEQDAKMHGSNNSYAVMIEQCYGKRENICSKNMNKFYVKYYPGLNILALYMYT